MELNELEYQKFVNIMSSRKYSTTVHNGGGKGHFSPRLGYILGVGDILLNKGGVFWLTNLYIL